MSLISRILSKKINVPFRWISKTIRNAFKEFPDPLDHATGLEKKEIMAFMEGNCDPYDMSVRKRGVGSKDNPSLIPSAFNGRIVGCICNNNRFINFMWLEKGCPKRCECGHWYKIKEIKSFV